MCVFARLRGGVCACTPLSGSAIFGREAGSQSRVKEARVLGVVASSSTGRLI